MNYLTNKVNAIKGGTSGMGSVK